jgi:hypothetical protein
METPTPPQYTIAKYYPISEALIGRIEAMKERHAFSGHYAWGYRHAIDEVCAHLRETYL